MRYQHILNVFTMPRNDSRLLDVSGEEKDEDLFDENDPDEEEEAEIPPSVETSQTGEEVLSKFKLKGERAEEVRILIT